MQTEEFYKLYEATWEQLDPLGHLRGPVLLDYVLNTQMSWITHYGYGQKELAAAGYDPVVLKLEARYHHEVLLGDTVRDTPQLSGLSPDGTMWKTYHQVIKTDGEKVATIKLEGTWFNWKNKQVVAPAIELLQVLRKGDIHFAPSAPALCQALTLRSFFPDIVWARGNARETSAFRGCRRVRRKPC